MQKLAYLQSHLWLSANEENPVNVGYCKDPVLCSGKLLFQF